MKQFKFRLQSVLDYRQSLLDRLRGELGSLQARLAQEERRLAELRASAQATLDRLARPPQHVVDLPEVLQLNEHLGVLETRIAEQALVVRRVGAEAEAVRSSYLELTKETKVLEKLRERQAGEFAVESQRLERAETSELAASRFRRLQEAL